MADIQFRLLSTPQIRIDSQPIKFGTHKVLALLAYLAVTGQVQSRAVLTTLLWPESDQAHANGSLRYVLVNARRQMLPSLFETHDGTIALRSDLPLAVDVRLFRNHIEQCRAYDHGETNACATYLDSLHAAVSLYQADFMDGFSLRDAPAFEEWLSFERERLRNDQASVLQRLTEHYIHWQAWEDATKYAQSWVHLDPWHEPAQRKLIQIYAWRGQRAAALEQAENCLRKLEEELGVPPEDETLILYQALRTNAPLPPPVSSATSTPTITQRPHASTATPLHNLSPLSTPFVGRTAELAEIVRNLHKAECRLLTISGPGGIGKTYLAMQVGKKLLEPKTSVELLPHGIFFVPLATVTTRESLISRIADTLMLASVGEEDARVQLLNYLRAKAFVLILDNFDQLLDEVNLLSEILATAPSVKILVTSREALRLREEWLYPIGGLGFPAPDHREIPLTKLESYDAVRLFSQSAQRSFPHFSLAAEEEYVIRICQLTEGVPLALELATTWLTVLTCKTVADELQRSLDILETSLRNMPDRHRSMRAIFEQSWRLLSTNATEVMRRLSVFRGGFDQNAAEHVASANRRVLAELIAKSLVHMEPNGRYRIHELLRQFAAEKLAESPEVLATTKQRHSEHYLSSFAQQAQALHGERQFALLEEFGHEIENIYLGWCWAARHGKVEWISQTLDALYTVFWMRSRLAEGVVAFHNATQLLAATDLDNPTATVLAALQARRGALLHLLGQHAEAEVLLENSLSAARRVNAKREVAFCLEFMGRIAWWQGSVQAAISLLEESLALHQDIQDRIGCATTSQTLARMHGSASEREKGAYYAQESLKISRECGHTYLTANALRRLATSAWTIGDYAEAVSYSAEGLAMIRKLGDRYSLALALAELGRSMHASGQYSREQFMRLLEEGATLSRKSGNYSAMYPAIGIHGKVSNFIGDYEVGLRCGQELVNLLPNQAYPYLPHSLIILGWGHLGCGHLQEARHHLQEAVAVASEPSLLVRSIMPWAQLAWAQLVLAESKQADVLLQPELAHQKQEQALVMVAQILSDPHATHYWKLFATQLVIDLEDLLPVEIAHAAKARGATYTAKRVISEILAPQAQ